MMKSINQLKLPFSLCGDVIRGDQRGRQWGIPTANLNMDNAALPDTGVFCVEVARDNGTRLSGVANLGTRPTVDGIKTILEVHIFNFNEDIYGENLKVVFLHKLRDEEKFSSVDQLIAQIKRDILAGREYFGGDLFTGASELG